MTADVKKALAIQVGRMQERKKLPPVKIPAEDVGIMD